MNSVHKKVLETQQVHLLVFRLASSLSFLRQKLVGGVQPYINTYKLAKIVWFEDNQNVSTP